MIVERDVDRGNLTTYYSDNRDVALMLYRDNSGCIKIKSEVTDRGSRLFLPLVRGEEGYNEKLLWRDDKREQLVKSRRYLIEGSLLSDEEINQFIEDLRFHVLESENSLTPATEH